MKRSCLNCVKYEVCIIRREVDAACNKWVRELKGIMSALPLFLGDQCQCRWHVFKEKED